MNPRPLRVVRDLAWLCLVVTVASGFAPLRARAAEEPFRLGARLGYQVDRLHSAVADSLGLSMTRATVVGVDYDFRIFSLPMAGAEKPAFHLTGDLLLGRRAVPVQEFSGPGFTGAPIDEVPVLEILSGFQLRVPMTVLDPGAGSALLLGYRGGIVLAGGAPQNDFPKVKQFVFGFERTRGFFAGSSVEMAYGTDESAGREFGAHRWDARVRVVAQLGAGRAAPATPAARPASGRAAVAAVPPPASAVRLFAELDFDTDGGIGPDLLMARGGVAFDVGRLLSRLLGPRG